MAEFFWMGWWMSAAGYYFLAALAIALAIWAWRPRRNLPPGPTGLPILGYLPFLGKEAHKTLHNLSKKYGPVFSLYLGRRLVVVLNTIEVVREALSDPNVMDRPPHPPNHLMPHSTSLSVSNGQTWRMQRNFTVQSLRRFGMGKEVLEDRIRSRIQGLELLIDSHGGRPMNLHRLLMPSVSDVVLSLLSSDEGAEEGGARRRTLDRALSTMTLYFRPTRLHAYFPGLRPWMERLRIWGYGEARDTMRNLDRLIRSEIERHKRTLDPGRPRDYIDDFLLAQRREPADNNTFTDAMLRGNLQSLLGAGSTPSRAALEWCLVSAAAHPEVQGRVHREVSGAGDVVSWSSRHLTPYTVAVVMEAMRHHTVIPISMLRTNRRPFRVQRFEVPPGSIVLTNIWGVHHDPGHWIEPHAFRPERFLDGEDGQPRKPPAFIPFSYGRRNCPGEDMAWMEVYIYFASLVLKYHILPPDSGSGFKTSLGIANMALPNNIRMVRRNIAKEKS